MPYKIKSRDTVYCGKVFSIDSVLLEFPDGHHALYELVKHSPSVTIIPVDAGGSVFFVRQYRLGTGQELLELPAGVIEMGETPEDCAQREVREEIGLAPRKLTALGQAYLIPGYGDELMYFFLAEDMTPAPLHPDPDEILKIEHCSISDAYAMAEHGQIRDSKTLAALMLARPVLKTK